MSSAALEMNHPAQHSTIGQVESAEEQTTEMTSPKMGSRDVKFQEDVEAYHRKFNEWSFKNCCRRFGKCLMKYVIRPIARAGVFVLGCTILLPWSIYLAATHHKHHCDDMRSPLVENHMGVKPEHSLETYASQVRIAADQMGETEKGGCRRCCDVCCPLLWPFKGVQLLVEKFDNWCESNNRSADQYLYSKKVPLSESERNFFEQRGYDPENPTPFPAAYMMAPQYV